MQEETINANQTLFDRLDIIERRITDNERQLEKLLDLYLSDGFPKEMLQERKSRLEEVLINLQREHADISSHLQTIVLSDEQIEDIEAFCSQLREGLDNANFEQKRQIIEMLDVRGKLSIENEEKVVYVKCILGQQLLSVVRTSHSSNTGAIANPRLVFQPMVRSR